MQTLKDCFTSANSTFEVHGLLRVVDAQAQNSLLVLELTLKMSGL